MTEIAASIGEPTGQNWVQLGELLIAFLLSSLIGLERQLRGKDAGLRTQAIVGTAVQGAAQVPGTRASR